MHDLVEKIPYTEILYLIENQVKYYADQVNQGNIYRGLAGRRILGSVSANYDRLVARGWTPYKASPALAGDKLRSFIRCIMSEDIDILNREIDKMDFFK